jgi:hypothetical protein
MPPVAVKAEGWIVTVAEPLAPDEAWLLAVTVTVAGEGTAAGAV